MPVTNQCDDKLFDFLLQKVGIRNAVLLFVIVSVMSLLDLTGIALIFPFLKVVTQQGGGSDLLARFGIAEKVSSTLTHKQLCAVLGFGLILFYMGKTYLQALLIRAQGRRLARFTSKLTNEFIAQILNARYAVFQKTPASQIAGTIHSSTVHASICVSALMQIGNEGLLLALLLLFFFLVNPILALSALSIAMVSGYLIYAMVIRRSSMLGAAQSRIEDNRYRLLFSIAMAIRDIKIMGLEQLFSARNNRSSYEYAEITWKYNLNQALPKLFIELCALLAIVATSLVVIFFNIPLDQAGPVLGVAAVAALRVAPGLTRIFSSASAFKFSRHIVKRLCDLEKEISGAVVVRLKDALCFTDSIKLENIYFSYGNKSILSNINMEIKPRESIGIVGSSGAGKSTLLDLITGLQQTTKGKFLCDGVEFDPFTSSSMQKFIGYVPQTITLLDDTISFNVSFEEKPDDARVMKALAIANLTNFVESLPDGIQTQVGENGVRLSGGQRQRIGIARALYRNPEILVFDEATSSLDTVSESELTAEIQKLKGSISMVIVAHRLSTVAGCDRIYVLADGRIESSGTHEELLRTSAIYRQLYSSQHITAE